MSRRWETARLAMLAVIAVLLFSMTDPYTAGTLSYYLVWVPMALGLCLLWGYGGVLSFGQTAFFGIAAYTYSVASINFGDGLAATSISLTLAIIGSTLIALLLGYFMFYGGVVDTFVSIVTLSTTLVLETFLSQTAGPQWRIGDARLNGYNGMTGMPIPQVPWFSGPIPLSGHVLAYVLVAAIFAIMLGLVNVLGSRFGRALVAVRENPLRAEMLGYDTAGIRLVAFVVSAGLAGVSGVFYVAWGEYITPSAMGLNAAALPVIWVVVGGRTSLTGVLIGTVGLLAISQQLAIFGDQYALVLLGVLAIIAVYSGRDGLVVAILRRISLWTHRLTNAVVAKRMGRNA
jgi:ABC-type branched-subunit amino acid transport system permease subunit